MKKKLTLHIHLAEWFLLPNVIKQQEKKYKVKKTSFLCVTIINLKVFGENEITVQEN